MNKSITHKTMNSYPEDINAENPTLSDSTGQGQTSPVTQGVPELGWRTAFAWHVNKAGEAAGERDVVWSSMIYDLLHSMSELGELLQYALQKKSWLDAYLLAAGMNQIAEDYLHPDPLFLGKSVKYLPKFPWHGEDLLVGAIQRTAQKLLWLNGWRSSTQQVSKWQYRLAGLVSDLALIVTGEVLLSAIKETELIEAGEDIIHQLVELPSNLKNEILKLPSCFRSFDQQPEDIRRIADEFSTHWPEGDRPLYVIGIRTSGSYLAPLYGAYLRARGYQEVKVLTLRPGSPFTHAERLIVRELVRGNGLALLCDDPPITGSTIVKTARVLEKLGVQTHRIIPLLQLNGDEMSIPASLQKYASIVMPGSIWSIYKQLDSLAVQKVLEDACSPDAHIAKLDRLFSIEENETRAHVKALYKVEIVDNCTEQHYVRLVQVKGVGLGYFGEHEVAIAEKLSQYSPDIIALQDGLMYREIPAPPKTLKPSMLAQDEQWQDELIKYILERNRQLPVKRDHSLHVRGRNAVWEVASNILSSAFGRGWIITRMPLVDPYIKRILRCVNPSIVDGDMALKNWYLREHSVPPVIKLDLAERAFSHMDLTCYDPVYDLAGAAVEAGGDREAALMRRNYEARSGEKISPERWMIYRLVRLWDLNRQEMNDSAVYSRKMAKAVQEYFAEFYFNDLPGSTSGPVCALDIDGVLESSPLGFPSLTQSSAQGLRALVQHGYRLLLATGRSVQDVIERCAAYHLAGGVAEYGAVIYDKSSGAVDCLLTEKELGTLFKLRGKLLNIHGVTIDPDYRYSIRAYQVDKAGKRSHLSDEVIQKVLSETRTEGMVAAVQGIAQTDFVISRINKATGLQEWLAHFSSNYEAQDEASGGTKSIAMVVGDSEADLPMLRLGGKSYAPAHAQAEFNTESIHITKSAYQKGFEEAVGSFLGHKPGGCPTCQETPLKSDTKYMIDLLSVQEGGIFNMIKQAIRLYFGKARNLDVCAE